MNPGYQGKAFFLSFLLLFTISLCNVVTGQTISTTGGTNYSGNAVVNGVGGVISFVVNNANTAGRLLSKIDCYARTDQPNNTYQLWYSTSTLSGNFTIAEPNWHLIKTGTPITTAADGITTVIDNINFPVAGNTQYRFALVADKGIVYSNSTAGTPTPNSFSAAGITLKVGNYQIAGGNVGYGGVFPTPAVANTPAFFTGAVHLSPCLSATNAATPSITPDTVVCGVGSNVILRVINGNLNDADKWTWHSGSCEGAVVGTGTSITVSPLVNTNYYVRGEGGCAAAPGNCASLGIALRTKPGTPVIHPVDPICVGGTAHLVIDPVSASTTAIPDSLLVNSGGLTILIPDNRANGLNTSLIVPALPAGAQITSMDITLSMVHPSPGDMIFNLKAPNGTVANLYKYNGGNFTGSFGNMPNAGWFDALVSSAGTVAFSSIDSPYRYNTGVLFTPDLYNGTVASPNTIPQNPTGFVSTATSLSQLYSVPNGTWRLAMADGKAGDLGTLMGWGIKIRYNTFQPIPASPAVWIPGSTLWVDEATTISYDGTTPRLDLYAKPLQTTIYTAQSSLGSCLSDPATITVTVNPGGSIADNTLPADTGICTPGTAAFKVIAAGTNLSYQWQTDNGTGNFTDITNGDNYSGAETDSLTVTNAPASWNGYQYHCMVVSNAPCADVIYSRDALLTIHPAPVVSLLATPYSTGQLIPGLVDTLKVSSLPAAAAYTWYFNNSEIAGAKGPAYPVTIHDQGMYKVSVIDLNGCTGTSNVFEIGDTASSRLFIYPNPAPGGKFAVSYYSVKGNILPRILTIYDAKGALVVNKIYTLVKPYDKMIVESGLSKGVYWINLLDRSGNRLATGKVIVQ